jgi:glycine/D-amino acid oxidase-like deaminating enzyme
MPVKNRCNVLIVGAGIVGVCAALHAAERNPSYEIDDQLALILRTSERADSQQGVYLVGRACCSSPGIWKPPE